MRPLLVLLIRLLPPAFRRRFGAELAEQMDRDYRRAREAGRWRAFRFALDTTADVVRTAIAERWSPGWVDTTRDRHHRGEVGMTGTLGEWTTELRHAVRTLRRSPGFAAVAVLTLALAIGANTSMFAVAQTVLIDPLPYEDADRLVYIASSAPGSEFPPEFPVSIEFLQHYRERSRLLESLEIYGDGSTTLRVGDRSERVQVPTVSYRTFEMLGALPILGRLPTEEDEGVILISHGLWTTWLGSDPSALGRAIEIAGGMQEIVGVMGPDFWYPDERAVGWIPQVITFEDITIGRFGVPLVARMAPGATIESVREELTAVAPEIPERYGGNANYFRIMETHQAVVRPLEEELVGAVAAPVRVLFGSMMIVLLIACANVANLFIVRAERRQRDVAMRRALGARRATLIRSQLAEAVVIALLAGVTAVGLAWLTVPVFLAAAPPNTPRLNEVSVSAVTLAFALLVSLGSALLCGIYPALRASSPNLSRLRDAARGPAGSRRWVSDGLVVGQTALALVLVIGSALLVRSFWALRNVDPGYEIENIFSFQFSPEADDLDDGPSYARFHQAFMDRLAALPGVESVGVVDNLPLDEGISSGRYLTERNPDDLGGGTLIRYNYAGGDFFEAMGIEVLAGRGFTPDDHESDLGNVIVSAAAAELLWPREEAIGNALKIRDQGDWMRVVGVVEEVRHNGFRQEPEPLVYHPLVGSPPDLWTITSPAYVVRSERADELAPEVREMVREVAPAAPMYAVHTMESLTADSMVELTFTMLTLGVASALALILGAVGLFGVLSYVVAERTREIGLRMALGAEASRVRSMVVAQGARVVILGIVLGVGAALLTTRLLGSMLFGVQAVDAATFAAMASAMVAVGLLASYLPARRASSVDPIEALRSE